MSFCTFTPALAFSDTVSPHVTMSFLCLEHFKGQNGGAIHFDDGQQEDLLCLAPLHCLVCGSGDHSDSCQPQSELPPPSVDSQPL